jgi:hypothetical protein
MSPLTDIRFCCAFHFFERPNSHGFTDVMIYEPCSFLRHAQARAIS